MSISNAPSIDIKEMLESSGAALGLAFGTNLFVSSMPEDPNDSICIYDTGGLPQGQYGFEYPNVQIIGRNLDYTIGYDLMRDIKYYLHQKRNGEVWGGTRYVDIETRSDILGLGQDNQLRYQWSLNFLVSRSGI